MLPTLTEFLERLTKEYNVKVRNLAEIPGLPPESQANLNARHLERLVGSNRWTYAQLPANLKDEDQLSPRLLNSLCQQLKIDPADFGVTLH